MRIEIEDATPRRGEKRIVTIVILVILFISLFGFLGVYFAKLYNFNFFENLMKSNEKYIEKKGQLSTTQQAQEDILLPKYTENSKKHMKNIYNKNTKIAYLTFDDGPSEVVTDLILNVLKEQNIKATFFVVGSNVKKYPKIVKRAYKEGHYIANHGYSHNYKKIYESSKSVLEEYEKTEKAIQNAIENSEYSSHLFRFPGGYSGSSYQKIKKQAGNLLNKNNISYIDWNVLTGDAQGANTKEMLLNNIEKYTKNKGNIVVLMHDSSSKILTYETLKEIINYLRAEGYTFDNFYSIMK